MSVRVKHFEWRQDEEGDYIADHPFGHEFIAVWCSNGVTSYEVIGIHEDFTTLDAAKAAVQAVYEARIWSALEVSQ